MLIYDDRTFPERAINCGFFSMTNNRKNCHLTDSMETAFALRNWAFSASAITPNEFNNKRDASYIYTVFFFFSRAPGTWPQTSRPRPFLRRPAFARKPTESRREFPGRVLAISGRPAERRRGKWRCDAAAKNAAAVFSRGDSNVGQGRLDLERTCPFYPYVYVCRIFLVKFY